MVESLQYRLNMDLHEDESIQALNNRLFGCMFGLAIGDAMGAPVEFMKRGSFAEVTGYQKGGKFRLQAGEWTDDTAMALSLAQSLIDTKGFDPIDQLDKYMDWLQHGYMSCTGKAIGVGKTVLRSLMNYHRTKRPHSDLTHEKFSGNGSLMRLAPVLIYYHCSLEDAVHYAALSSKTTHASALAVDSCRYMAYILVKLFNGSDKNELFSENFIHELQQFFQHDPLHLEVMEIASGMFIAKCIDDIQSTGYVIHSLEAALWSFYHTDYFETAILKAVNFGDDADTVGAITGQIAGAYYGKKGIPGQLLNDLAKYEMIEIITDELIHRRNETENQRAIKSVSYTNHKGLG